MNIVCTDDLRGLFKLSSALPTIISLVSQCKRRENIIKILDLFRSVSWK